MADEFDPNEGLLAQTGGMTDECDSCGDVVPPSSDPSRLCEVCADE